MKKKHYVFTLLLCCLFSGCKERAPEFDIDSPASVKGTRVYEPTVESFRANYHFPQWFEDGKFGIFVHWGPYSVAAFGSEWYPRNMYRQGSSAYEHHRATWGDHTKFGYKDFIPLFTAEKFDADQWTDLFVEAGARYVVPVAEHHDGFAMYDSRSNRWNAVEMGPKKDIVGIMKKAIEERGLVFGLSTHRGENYYFFNGGMKFPSDVQDTTITLYGSRVPDEGKHPDSTFLRGWLTHLYELVNGYQPQMIFFDGTPGDADFAPYFRQFIAHYYNSAIDWGKEVGVNYKLGFPSDLAIFDVERGRLKGIRRNPWQSDTSVGIKSWCYVEGEIYKTPEQLIQDMVDVVSKKGSFLLNIGPKADGSIPEGIQQTLRDIGKWLKVNGEAIYGTRIWAKYGEGNTQANSGSFSDGNSTPYSAQDIRFTAKGSDLYAMCLKWADGDITITSLRKERVKDLKINDVTMLGSDEKIEWLLTDEGLKIKFPAKKPCEYVYSFKIKMEGVVISEVQPYFVERDSSAPKTADTYIYNHNSVPVTVTAKLYWDDKEWESHKVTVVPGTYRRIESDISSLPDAPKEPQRFNTALE